VAEQLRTARFTSSAVGQGRDASLSRCRSCSRSQARGGDYRRFKFEIAKIAANDAMLGYALTLEHAAGRKNQACGCGAVMATRGQRRALSPDPRGSPGVAAGYRGSARAKTAPPVDGPVNAKAAICFALAGLTQKAVAGYITDATFETLRAKCPGWDYQTLHAEFKNWIGGDP
jgi:hypothetical protein